MTLVELFILALGLVYFVMGIRFILNKTVGGEESWVKRWNG